MSQPGRTLTIAAVGFLLLDAVLLADAVQVVRDPSARSARRLFYHSMAYLALLFAVMALDRVVAGH